MQENPIRDHRHRHLALRHDHRKSTLRPARGHVGGRLVNQAVIGKSSSDPNGLDRYLCLLSAHIALRRASEKQRPDLNSLQKGLSMELP